MTVRVQELKVGDVVRHVLGSEGFTVVSTDPVIANRVVTVTQGDEWDLVGRTVTPYQQILNHFGLDNQLDKTVEECAELIVAITHWKSGKVNREEMITEIADVAVMVEQLRIAFPEVDAEKERKVKRTIGRIR